MQIKNFSTLDPAASVDMAALADAAEAAARLLRAMAHGPRLRILCMLVNGEMSSGEIARSAGLREPAASQQLALLRAEKLVETRREGQKILYAVTNPVVMKILGNLTDAFCPQPTTPATAIPASTA
jgi:ArsR family transcriptional regulator, virulence genes transcriptional regulator